MRAAIAKRNRARQPSWTRDELILALDLYFREPRSRGNPRHPETILLSKRLNTFSIHAPHLRGEHFRNPSGIGMQLMNFTRLDPAYRSRGKVGMSHGSRLQDQLWKDFHNNQEGLRRIASAITALGPAVSAPSLILDDEDEASEGKILTRVHKLRERNKRLVAAKKALVKKSSGRLACEVCQFDFELAYGLLGSGYAECHHIAPLSSLKHEQTTSLNDLAIVCANCHRMLHRRHSWLTVAELRDILIRQSAKKPS